MKIEDDENQRPAEIMEEQCPQETDESAKPPVLENCPYVNADKVKRISDWFSTQEQEWAASSDAPPAELRNLPKLREKPPHEPISDRHRKRLMGYVKRMYQEAVISNGERLLAVSLEQVDMIEVPEDYYSEDGLCKLVEKSLDQMDGEFRVILINEYFQKKPPRWWEEKYSKSMYYVRLKMAEEQFLDIFLNCHYY